MIEQSKGTSATEYLSEADVLGIAEYVRIGMTAEEVSAMTKDLNETLAGFEALRTYDLEGVEPTFLPIGDLSNVMREDAEEPGLSREAALSNTAEKQDGYFVIPSILGAGDEE